MNTVFSTKIYPFLKKLILIAVLIFISTFIEIYWSMNSLSERVSSGNPDSHFFDDAYLISVFTTIILTIVFLGFSFVKKTYLKIALELLCLISVWFFWNYSIFVDRESSWSTYLFREEILYTLSLALFPILVLSLATTFILNYTLKKIWI